MGGSFGMLSLWTKVKATERVCGERLWAIFLSFSACNTILRMAIFVFVHPSQRNGGMALPSREQTAVCVVLGGSIDVQYQRFQVQLCVRAGCEIYFVLFFVVSFPCFFFCGLGAG